MSSYFAAMKNFANFSGRSSRREIWVFTFFLTLLLGIAILGDQMLGTDNIMNVSQHRPGLLVSIWYAVHAIPSLSLTVRRLHDTNRRGWWILVAFTGIGNFLLFIFFSLRGTVGSNRFGFDPYAPAAADHVEPVLADLRSDFYAPTAASMREMPPVRATNLRQRQDDQASDPIAEIERLAYLRQQGDITDAEFEVLKARALSRVH